MAKKKTSKSEPANTAGKKRAKISPTALSRSAEEIAVTAVGPRPIPELSTARNVTHPELAGKTIGNGLRVIAVRKPGAPLVEVRLRVPFGGRTAAHSARAELLAATLLLGTNSRSREQVDAELALVGGHLDASVDPQRLGVTGSVLSTGLPVLLEVLAQSLTQPAFRRHDVLGERDRLVEQLAIAASQPSVVARHHLQVRRFGSHPVTREMPDATAVAGVGIAALRGLQQKAVVPSGSTLVLVGDLEPARAIGLVESAMAGWTSPNFAEVLTTPNAVQGGPVKAFHRQGAVQSQVRLSATAFERTDPDYPAGQLANLIYGGYFSSRLVENLREDKGYTYGAQSNFEFWPSRAAMTVSFDTNTASTAAALLEARYELGRLALTAPTETEVESARNYALGTLATSLATQAGYASTLSSLAGVHLDVNWLREHPARLSAVTVDDVARVAGTLLAPSAFTGVIVADMESVGASLAAVGDVEL
jgi:zinc protease